MEKEMNKNSVFRVGILGATGYTGRELVRILSHHPQVRIDFLGTSSAQGQKYFNIYPELCGCPIGNMTLTDEHDVPQVDVLFCALPHGIMAERAANLLVRGIKIIDLGADFRLKDPAEYELWYNCVHPDPDLLSQAVYGVSEIYRREIFTSSLVALPGCYPTASLLPLAPLLRHGLIDIDSIVIDAKSGVSGAGRGVTPQLHFSEVDANFKAYGVDGHRHRPEIEQELSKMAGGKPIHISFTPHLVPMVRGMLATIYVRVKDGIEEEDLRRCWQTAYEDESFVHVMPCGVWPMTKHACGHNSAYMQVSLDRRTRRATLVSVLDNLMKGAAGQAVQNMNIMCGLPETQGLASVGIWP